MARLSRCKWSSQLSPLLHDTDHVLLPGGATVRPLPGTAGVPLHQDATAEGLGHAPLPGEGDPQVGQDHDHPGDEEEGAPVLVNLGDLLQRAQVDPKSF